MSIAAMPCATHAPSKNLKDSAFVSSQARVVELTDRIIEVLAELTEQVNG
jgi:hypothetical protein